MGEKPHGYVKLWKHHAAQDEANALNEKAAERGERFLKRYGGKISSEWMFPKIWQVLNEAPDVYAASDRFMEAADWVVMQLTGMSAGIAARQVTRPHGRRARATLKEFFKELDPRLENVWRETPRRNLFARAKAGELTPAMAAGWA